MKEIITFFCFLLSTSTYGQYLLAMNTEWDDSFKSWEIQIEKDSLILEGTLELTWSLQSNFSNWYYRIDSIYGEISQKFANDTGIWELKSEGHIVVIRQVWPNDLTQWKISFDNQSFIFRSRYSDILDDWYMTDESLGELLLYTEYQGDARDWVINDYMSESIPFHARLAAVFIGIYISAPKI